MKKAIIFASSLALLTVVLILFIRSRTDKGISDEDFRLARQQGLKAFAIDLPEEIDFAGEDVPLDLFWVREALDRELTTNVYWHSSTLLLMKRANRFLGIIEPIIKSHGIPDDIKYMALVESNLLNVTSPSGAVGFWQFMKETAREYGLEVNEEVDQRYDLRLATGAACRYLLKAREKFGSWTLAAAAYNAGFDNVGTPLANQKASGFYDVLLNQETSRYIFRILAVKEIMENPEKYGFFCRATDLYPPIPYRTIKVDSSVTDLNALAAGYGINYKILKEFNPWLRKNTLTNKTKKLYEIIMPVKEYLYYTKLREAVKGDTL